MAKPAHRNGETPQMFQDSLATLFTNNKLETTAEIR